MHFSFILHSLEMFINQNLCADLHTVSQKSNAQLHFFQNRVKCQVLTPNTDHHIFLKVYVSISIWHMYTLEIFIDPKNSALICTLHDRTVINNYISFLPNQKLAGDRVRQEYLGRNSLNLIWGRTSPTRRQMSDNEYSVALKI